jgi:hypothetical protein
VSKGFGHTEDQKVYSYVLNHCPTLAIIPQVTTTFFPDITDANKFDITDIITTNVNYTHGIYKDTGGEDLINLVSNSDNNLFQAPPFFDDYYCKVTVYHTLYMM